MLVVSPDRDLFNSVRAVLAAADRFTDAGGLVHCDGEAAPLTNIHPVTLSTAEWEGWKRADGGMPTPASMRALIFECRSPEWVAEVGTLLAAGLKAPVWIVDSADHVWLADQVDPHRLALA